jgi:alpha-tubulin suppressor-like RCC1 family protein
VIGWGSSNSGEATGIIGGSTNGIVTVAGQALSNIVSVACGSAHGLALKGDGTVIAWGWNFYGQATVPGGLSNVTAIAAGENFSVALKQDGTVTAWGNNGDYQLTNTPMSLNNVVAVSAGTTHIVALKNDDTVTGWGVPKAPLDLSNIVAVATGSGYYSDNLALKKDGTVIEWGANGDKIPVPDGLSSVVAIATGESYCMALDKKGIVTEWNNRNNQASEILSNVTAIASYGNYNLALKDDGTVVGWGHGRFYPRLVPAGLSNIVTIAVGGDFCLAITTNRAVAEKFMH